MQIVIVGAGSVGYDLAVQLRKAKHDVSMVDIDPDRTSAACERLDILVVNGSGCSPKALESGGIRGADTLLAVSSSDEVNILACGIAAQYGVGKRVARIRSAEFTDANAVVEIQKLGVTHVIDPEMAVVRVIEQNIRVPEALEVFNYHEGAILICRHILREDMPVVGRTLSESLHLISDQNLLAVAIHRDGETWIPGGDDIPRAGDDLVTLLPKSSLTHYEELLDLTRLRVRKVVVAGDSLIALELCRVLKLWVEDVTLLDPSESHGLRAAEELDGVEVVHGPATERASLDEVNVGGADFFVGASQDTTSNVMGALLASSEGAREVLAISYTPGSNRLFREIGVDYVVSPRRAIAQAIMDLIQRGNAQVELQLRDLDIESVELTAEEGSHVTRGPLHTTWQTLRREAVVGAVFRNGELLIAGGGTEIQAGDEVVVVTRPRAIEKVRREFGKRSS